MEEKEVTLTIPQYEAAPITHEALQREFNFLTARRFVEKMLNDGIITVDEFNKIMPKIRDKFSPLYPEIRA